MGEEEGTAMADCVIAEDSDFCKCVVENEGNVELVRCISTGRSHQQTCS